MIKATVIGRATSDAEFNTSKNGKDYAKFKMAVTDYSSKDSEGKFGTTWVDVICFGYVAQRAQSVCKGLTVAVSGSATVRGYTKSDGTVGTALNIQADDVELCERPRDNGGQQQRPARSRQQASVQAQAPSDDYSMWDDE